MNHRKIVLAALFIVLSFPQAIVAQTNKLSVAVMQLDALGIQKAEAATLTDRLRNELFRTQRFHVTEREKMDEILKEQGFQQTGCTSSECIVEVGMLLGVQRMIGGSIGKVGRTYTISLRMIDVEKGEIVQAPTEDFQGEIDVLLITIIPRMAQQLAGIAVAIPAPQGRQTTPAIQNPAGIEFVLIPGGTFDMGDTFNEGAADEKPVHSVTVSDFYMSKTEVTVAQYRAFCTATNRSMPSAPSWGWQDDHPMVYVTWNDAIAFCQWAGCRLPTEAEWEYAAREKGRKVRFGNGKDIANPAEINFDGSAGGKKPYSVVGVYRQKTTAVASFAPNALGLYDMSGNVWEWCADWYETNYYQNRVSTNPKGPSSGESRVGRGGSWYFIPRFVRCSYRSDNYGPNSRSYDVGFRCVR